MQLQKLQEQQQPEHAGMELRKPDNNLSVTFGGASPASMQSREPKPGQAVEQGLDLLSGSSTPGTRFAQLELELLQLRHLVGQQQQTIATQQVAAHLQRAVPVAPEPQSPRAAAHDSDSDQPHERLKLRARKRSVCRRCGESFILSKNHPMACRSHPGRWVTPPNSRAHALRSAANQLVMGSQSRYHAEVAPPPGKWTCCGSRVLHDPGCVAESHVA